MTTAPAACSMCASTPTLTIAVRRHVGMILMQKFYKYRQPLCRTCGLNLVTGWTRRTLVQGWWGYISFFFNIFVVLANAVAAARFSRMQYPMRPLDGSLPAASPIVAH